MTSKNTLAPRFQPSLAVYGEAMPNGLRCFTEKLVLGCLVPWFWTLGFVWGGLVVQPCAASAAFLVVISLGRRPAGVAGGGAARRVGEPRRGALYPFALKFKVTPRTRTFSLILFLIPFLCFGFFR